MRLLLTVTGVDEVETALAAGADLVDVKAPCRGSLGPPGPTTLARVADHLAGRTELGVPLGDGPHHPDALSERVETAGDAGAGYLKLGLLGRGAAGGEAGHGTGGEAALSAGDALVAARRRARSAGGDPAVMAVTFADAPEGGAPGPDELIELADAAGADGVMLDTLGKGEGSVVEYVGRARLERWCRRAGDRGLLTAVAGGLDASAVERLRGTAADVVGVRTGACAGGRDGRLDPGRCRAIRRAVDRASAPRPAG